MVAPSTTIIDGRLAIRAAIVNHRTSQKEIDLLVEKTVALGRAMEASAARSRAPLQPAGTDWPPQRAREAALRDLNGRIAVRSRRRELCDLSSPVCWPSWAGLWKRATRIWTCWRASPRTGWR